MKWKVTHSITKEEIEVSTAGAPVASVNGISVYVPPGFANCYVAGVARWNELLLVSKADVIAVQQLVDRNGCAWLNFDSIAGNWSATAILMDDGHSLYVQEALQHQIV